MPLICRTAALVNSPFHLVYSRMAWLNVGGQIGQAGQVMA